MGIPQADYVKLNVDEVIFDLEKIGIDVIVWDNRGKALFAASLAEMNVAQLESIEALYILRGLQLCTHQGFTKLIIKSDYMPIVEELVKQEFFNSIFGNIILDIKELMCQFYNCKVQHLNW